jgi:hypothetical protein
MLVDCPHCLTEVLPQADGTCPSCLGDTTAEVANDWAKVRVHETTELPDICCTCGVHTPDVEVVGAETNDGAPTWVRIVALLVRPSLFFRPELQGNRTLFDIAMSRCIECQREGRLLPEHVDEPHRRMTFIVVRKFKELLGRSVASS